MRRNCCVLPGQKPRSCKLAPQEQIIHDMTMSAMGGSESVRETLSSASAFFSLGILLNSDTVAVGRCCHTSTEDSDRMQRLVLTARERVEIDRFVQALAARLGELESGRAGVWPCQQDVRRDAQTSCNSH